MPDFAVIRGIVLSTSCLTEQQTDANSFCLSFACKNAISYIRLFDSDTQIKFLNCQQQGDFWLIFHTWSGRNCIFSYFEDKYCALCRWIQKSYELCSCFLAAYNDGYQYHWYIHKSIFKGGQNINAVCLISLNEELLPKYSMLSYASLRVLALLGCSSKASGIDCPWILRWSVSSVSEKTYWCVTWSVLACPNVFKLFCIMEQYEK